MTMPYKITKISSNNKSNELKRYKLEVKADFVDDNYEPSQIASLPISAYHDSPVTKVRFATQNLPDEEWVARPLGTTLAKTQPTLKPDQTETSQGTQDGTQPTQPCSNRSSAEDIDWLEHINERSYQGISASTVWASLLSLRNDQKHIFPQKPKNSIFFGRSSKCDVKIDNRLLSHQHAELGIIQKNESDETKHEVYIKDLKSFNGTFVNGKRLEPYVITKLKDGDYIQFSLHGENRSEKHDDAWFVFYKHFVLAEDVYMVLHESLKPEDRYVVGPEVGKGHYSRVSFGKHKYTRKPVAIKRLSKERFEIKEFKREYIKRELEILHKVSHPFIVEVIDNYDCDSFYNIVLGYYPEGDLFDFIKQKDIPEFKLVRITYQILSAIKYLHKYNIIHRDIKPENILIVNSETQRVVLTDFGLARFSEGRKTFDSLVGSASYAPPELNNFSKHREYGYECDIWSLGVMVYVGATHRMPFYFAKERAIVESDLPPIFEDKFWSKSSETLRQFVKSCLTYQPNNRPTPLQGLRHSLFVKYQNELLDLMRDELAFVSMPKKLKICNRHISNETMRRIRSQIN